MLGLAVDSALTGNYTISIIATLIYQTGLIFSTTLIVLLILIKKKEEISNNPMKMMGKAMEKMNDKQQR